MGRQEVTSCFNASLFSHSKSRHLILKIVAGPSWQLQCSEVENLSMDLSLPGSGSHLLSQLLVFGLQVLAVATPRSVELDQNVFAVVIDDGVKVLRHHHLQTGGGSSSSPSSAQQNSSLGCSLTLTGPSLFSGTGSDFRYGLRVPSK